MYKNTFFFFAFSLLLLSSCGSNDPAPMDCNFTEIDEQTSILGYDMLEKLPGIWNGPVTSSTPLGGFPEWIVDFRPISAAHVAAKNELDKENDIFMSFFIVKHDCQAKIAFRNGGGFAGMQRNSYMLLDSVYENASIDYYRFSDPVSGGDRVYSDVIFKQDSLSIEVYTNKYNTLASPVTHMHWKANLRNDAASASAISLFDFPQKQLERDFTNTFDGLSEAVFYSSAQDPFPEEDQPHLGQTNVEVQIAQPSVVDPSKKVLFLITTEPLFNGVIFDVNQLDTRSRYVLLDAEATVDFSFNYMHPGQYYINALYDANGDLNFSSGDYINTPFDQSFILSPEGQTDEQIVINMQIP